MQSEHMIYKYNALHSNFQANDGTVSVSSSDPVNFAPAYDAATGALKVTYTEAADASNNARVSTQTSGAVVGSNIWLNKKTDATFQTSAIKLYGATACVFSFVQGGSSSAATIDFLCLKVK